jgi:hypothetical protein
MTDETETPKPPSLEEILGTADPERQTQYVAELVRRFNFLNNATELSLAVYFRPSDNRVRLIAPEAQSLDVILAVLDIARNSVLETRIRRELEAKQKPND